jgi:tetratricopeptide (TPR) repeat protein
MDKHQKALSLNEQANDYALKMRYSKALIYYKEALVIYLSLAKNNPTEYCLPIAHIFSNLSIVYFSLEQAQKSDELHQNALRMHRVLARTNPNKHAVDFVRCLIDGVRYLGQHSLTLYEAEIVLNQIRHARGTDKLVRVIRKLHSLSVAS